ncbi:MAG: TetR/AcrR family transcriptional regulator [Myxococcota bacterium]
MAVSSRSDSRTAPIESTARETRGAGARSRAATRARLRASGLALFAERGLHGVTTHDIARGAGVAAGTFYLHFRDKRQLFREIAGEAVAELRERLERALESHDDPERRVRAHARAMVHFAAENRAVMRILFSGDSDAAVVEHDVLDDLAASMAEARRKRSAEGGPPSHLDPAVLSQAVVGMWARVVAWWTEDPNRAEPDAVVETLSRIQLSGTEPK